ncbi:hypothetical protein D3C87_1037050 [compost metagenome]
MTNDEGEIKEFKDQWHAGITSQPKQKFRFLTIIQIKDGKTEVIKTLSNKDGITSLQVGDWNIKAQLNGEKPAALQVSGNAVKSMFSYGNLPIQFEGKKYMQNIDGSSLLLEIDHAKVVRQEAIDELPDAAKYDKN